MSEFKDLLKQDLNTFFNVDEFAESVEINGVSVVVVNDEYELELIKNKDTSGLVTGDILIFITDSEYQKIPKVSCPPEVGDVLMYSGKPATITKTSTEDGVNKIILQFTGGRPWR